jgi:hypothetical protein
MNGGVFAGLVERGVGDEDAAIADGDIDGVGGEDSFLGGDEAAVDGDFVDGHLGEASESDGGFGAGAVDVGNLEIAEFGGFVGGFGF